MHKRTALPLAILSMFVASACATYAGQSVDLHGKLALSGNDVWQLEGVPIERASTLQNQQVRVHGVVIRDRSQGPELPAVEVQSLKVVPAS